MEPPDSPALSLDNSRLSHGPHLLAGGAMLLEEKTRDNSMAEACVSRIDEEKDSVRELCPMLQAL